MQLLALKHAHRWFGGLPKEEKEEFDDYLNNSQKVLDKLDEICYNMIQEAESKVSNDYDSPSWAYHQADFVGFKRALTNVRNLLKQSDKD